MRMQGRLSTHLGAVTQQLRSERATDDTQRRQLRRERRNDGRCPDASGSDPSRGAERGVRNCSQEVDGVDGDGGH